MDNRLAHDLQLLKDKGLAWTDEEEVLGYIKYIGYHRISIYMVGSTNFTDVKRKYIFDKRLRILLLDMLEVIENACKSVMCYHLGSHFATHIWYVEATVYQQKYATRRLSYIDRKTEELKKHDVTAKKYFAQYPKETYLPEYIFFDKLTFGELIYIFKDLRTSYKKQISNYYGINYQLFENWIDCLRYLRNLCSHYEPVYFRKMLYVVKGYGIESAVGTRNGFGAYLLLVGLFQKLLMPNYTWHEKVFSLMDKFDIGIEDISLKNKNLPSKLTSEAWEVLLTPVYGKNIKNANRNSRQF